VSDGHVAAGVDISDVDLEQGRAKHLPKATSLLGPTTHQPSTPEQGRSGFNILHGIRRLCSEVHVNFTFLITDAIVQNLRVYCTQV
jgi:hypothetical protein